MKRLGEYPIRFVALAVIMLVVALNGPAVAKPLPKSGVWTAEVGGWTLHLTKRNSLLQAKIDFAKNPKDEQRSVMSCNQPTFDAEGYIEIWCGGVGVFPRRQITGEFPILKMWDESKGRLVKFSLAEPDAGNSTSLGTGDLARPVNRTLLKPDATIGVKAIISPTTYHLDPTRFGQNLCEDDISLENYKIDTSIECEIGYLSLYGSLDKSGRVLSISFRAC